MAEMIEDGNQTYSTVRGRVARPPDLAHRNTKERRRDGK
jgi:hypothetical protein